MSSLLSTENLARFSARRPWYVIGGWIVAFVIAGIFVQGAGLQTTTQVVLQNNPESQRGWDLLEEHGLRTEIPSRETVIVTSKAEGTEANALTVDSPEFRQTVEAITAALRGAPDLVDPGSVVNYYELNGQTPDAAQGLVSEDRRTTLIPVTFVGSPDDALDNGPEYLDVLDRQKETLPAGLAVMTVGDVSINEELGSIAEEDLQRGEGIGVPIAFIILIFVFGAILAAVLPLILAIFAIAVAFGLTALASQVGELSFFVTNMITMIGLAVGIDYSLFIVQRYREERQHGFNKREAIVAAGGTASRAVFFSGMTVVLALLGLFLVPNNIYRSLSVGAVLVVVVSVIATLTLVPALLSLLGDRIDWPRKRNYGAAQLAPRDRYEDAIHGGFWGNVTRIVMDNPLISVILAVAFLLLCVLPFRDYRDGLSGASSLPNELETKEAFLLLSSEFQAGRVAPVEIVVDGPVNDPAVQGGIDRLRQALAAETTEGGAPLFGPASVTPSQDGELALISVPLGVAPDEPAAFDSIGWLRDDAIPTAFNGVAGTDVLVTGQTANYADFFEIKETYTPIVFVFVLGLSFIVLLLAFRSIVIPIMAIILNLLSVGAAYGLIVWVFQKGNLVDLFGFQQTPTIEAWLPLMLFAVLFGLSMDYHVFLLSRIREHYAVSHQNRESVAVGLHSTARMITGAALIMVAVFAGFASGRLVSLQQMGFGLAVAVLIDATIIRSVLVPASMALLGDRNWYLPSWLAWLPDLRIEGKSPAAPVPAVVPAGSSDD